MNRALVLTAHYPPIRGSQATRAAKLLKHLGMFGWQCDIVCAESDPAFGFDESQLQDVPDSATVVRTNPNAYRLSRIPRKFSLPDHLASWIPGAVVTALNLERKRHYNALASLSFPASSHVAALAVHTLTGLPWLADFSDPWMNNPYSGPDRRSFRSFAGKVLERKVLERAACLGFTCPELEDFVSKRYPTIREKSVELRSACERTDFEDLPARFPGDKFTLVHVGSLYGLRQPTSLLRGFARFLHANPEARVALRLIGTWKPLGQLNEGDPVLRDRVDVVPPMNRRAALKEMRSADLLVLIDPSVTEPSIFLPLKLSEYLMSGRPILALTGEGPSERLIREHRAGAVVRFDDEGGVAEQIERFYEARSDLIPDLREVDDLESTTVGRDFAAALDCIAR